MAKRQTSVRKREREMQKRQREQEKARKAAEKREKRLSRTGDETPTPAVVVDISKESLDEQR